MSKQPLPAPTASAIGPSPTMIQIYITRIAISNNTPHLILQKNQNRRAAFGRPANEIKISSKRLKKQGIDLATPGLIVQRVIRFTRAAPDYMVKPSETETETPSC